MDYTRPHWHANETEVEYTEYRDEYGTVVLLEDRSRSGAWLLSTVGVPVEP
jgi:hypothetical protein